MLTKIGKPAAAGDAVGLLLECHERIRSFLALARRIAEVGPSAPGTVPEAAARVRRYFTEALPLHARDEEESILPRLRGLDPTVDAPRRRARRPRAALRYRFRFAWAISSQLLRVEVKGCSAARTRSRRGLELGSARWYAATRIALPICESSSRSARLAKGTLRARARERAVLPPAPRGLPRVDRAILAVRAEERRSRSER